MIISHADGLDASITKLLTGKYRDDITILGPIVTLHDQLMSTCHQGEAVVVVEGF